MPVPCRSAPKLALARDGRRGDTRIDLERVDGLSPGDCIQVNGPASERWKKLTKNACRWGIYRRYEVVVEGIDGNEVTVNQPLRKTEQQLLSLNLRQKTPFFTMGYTILLPSIPSSV